MISDFQITGVESRIKFINFAFEAEVINFNVEGGGERDRCIPETKDKQYHGGEGSPGV